MKIDPRRYTNGRVAVTNLSASIASLEMRRLDRPTVADLLTLSSLLFLRGDVLGRIADHDRAEVIGNEAVESSRGTGTALLTAVRLAHRFHRFEEANALIDRAHVDGHTTREIDGEKAGLLQATGRYEEALALRERLANAHPGIDTIGALASLLAEMDRWSSAQACYVAALDEDRGVSPFPCAQLLFEWGVSAMRRGDLNGAEERLANLAEILPAHAPGRGHRAEIALALGRLDVAESLIKPLLSLSDDPEYRAIYAEILAARGAAESAIEAQRTVQGYEQLLARRPEAYADHAAEFFMGVGDRPQRAVELATTNWKLRDTPRSRELLDKALHKARLASVGAA